MLQTNLFRTLKKNGHFIELYVFLLIIVAGSYSIFFFFESNQKYIEEV